MTTILRSHIILLVYKWPLNNDHLSVKAIILGSHIQGVFLKWERKKNVKRPGVIGVRPFCRIDFRSVEETFFENKTKQNILIFYISKNKNRKINNQLMNIHVPVFLFFQAICKFTHFFLSHKHKRINTHIRAHTYTHILSQAPKHAHISAVHIGCFLHTHTHTHSHTLIDTCSHTLIDTCSHTLIDTCSHNWSKCCLLYSNEFVVFGIVPRKCDVKESSFMSQLWHFVTNWTFHFVKIWNSNIIMWQFGKQNKNNVCNSPFIVLCRLKQKPIKWNLKLIFSSFSFFDFDVITPISTVLIMLRLKQKSKKIVEKGVKLYRIRWKCG